MYKVFIILVILFTYYLYKYKVQNNIEFFVKNECKKCNLGKELCLTKNLSTFMCRKKNKKHSSNNKYINNNNNKYINNNKFDKGKKISNKDDYNIKTYRYQQNKNPKKQYICPNTYNKCLSKEYINKCGWCYSRTRQNHCSHGNETGPYNDKCENGWKTLKIPGKIGNNEWQPANVLNIKNNLLGMNNDSKIIRCSYGPECYLNNSLQKQYPQ
jgi:hypothetical protein